VLRAAAEYDEYATPLSQLDSHFHPVHYDVVDALRAIPADEFKETALLVENYRLWIAGGGSIEEGNQVAEKIKARMRSYLPSLLPHADVNPEVLKMHAASQLRIRERKLAEDLKISASSLSKKELSLMPKPAIEMRLGMRARRIAEVTRRYDEVASKLSALDPDFQPVKIPVIEKIRLIPPEVIERSHLQVMTMIESQFKPMSRETRSASQQLSRTLAPYIGSFLAVAMIVGPAIKAYQAFAPSEHDAPSAGSASQMNASVFIGAGTQTGKPQN
jgi:hypothetical protein